MHEHAPDVFVDRGRAEGEMVRWIGTEGEAMLDYFAGTAISEWGRVGGD